MANARNGNTYYIDEVSDSGDDTSFVEDRGLLIIGIVFDGSAAGDAIVINDKSASSAAAGDKKLKVEAVNAKETVFLDLSGCPISMPNGIWVSSLSASSVCTLILTRVGG